MKRIELPKLSDIPEIIFVNNAVLISIQPKWCEKIISGEKIIEVRKTKPKIETPFMVYIYCTNSKPYLYKNANKNEYFLDSDLYRGGSYEDRFLSGKVIGEFVCDRIETFSEWQLEPFGKYRDLIEKELLRFIKETCLSYDDLRNYRKNMPYYNPLYGWHITDLEIYDKPKELSEFGKYVKKQNIIDKGCEVVIEDCREFKPLERPPQSWCYVEVKNG